MQLLMSAVVARACARCGSEVYSNDGRELTCVVCSRIKRPAGFKPAAYTPETAQISTAPKVERPRFYKPKPAKPKRKEGAKVMVQTDKTKVEEITVELPIEIRDADKPLGWHFPTSITQTVWNELIEPCEAARELGESTSSRVREFLTVAAFSVPRQRPFDNRYEFSVSVLVERSRIQRRNFTLNAHISGPEYAPEVTISFPWED